MDDNRKRYTVRIGSPHTIYAVAIDFRFSFTISNRSNNVPEHALCTGTVYNEITANNATLDEQEMSPKSEETRREHRKCLECLPDLSPYVLNERSDK